MNHLASRQLSIGQVHDRVRFGGRLPSGGGSASTFGQRALRRTFHAYRSQRTLRVLAFVLACASLTLVTGHSAARAQSSGPLSNGGFEDGVFAPSSWPTDWQWSEWQPISYPVWDDTVFFAGEKSVKIESPVENDARWIQTVDVEPGNHYFLSGWMKTDGVAPVDGSGGVGANLSHIGTWTSSDHLTGTRSWTCTGVRLDSGSDQQVTVGARLGHWGGVAAGTAWFDDLKLRPIVAAEPHPSWQILVLIYQDTDFEVVDDDGTRHHYVASMTLEEVQEAALAATQFVEVDIPALTSGNMVPEVTVRFPERALTELAPVGGGWWPNPRATAPERDIGFDSVIVIWDPRASDLETGLEEWIGFGDGLAVDRGVNQTYFSMQVDAAIYRGHRNVFKHEWGHSILSYFDAAGTAPKPPVTNHTDGTQYVNCQTGLFYVWEGETLENPIPDSIYNNESGFTHDYYSGTVATADDATRCLGIPPEAWALGGPLSNSGNPCPVPEPGAAAGTLAALGTLLAVRKGRSLT